MAKIEDITGQRFGRLTVVDFFIKKANKSYWLCVCDCGLESVVRGSHLTSKKIVSCGCRRKTSRLTHGRSGDVEYLAWRAAKSRCFNPKNPAYENYGGRGITMSEEWKTSFDQFFKDMGPSNGLTLERIDNNGNYTVGNCRWTTQYEQIQNQRKTLRITHDGETLSLRAWSRKTGIAYSTLRKRYDKGLPLFAPVQLEHSHSKVRK